MEVLYKGLFTPLALAVLRRKGLGTRLGIWVDTFPANSLSLPTHHTVLLLMPQATSFSSTQVVCTLTAAVAAADSTMVCLLWATAPPTIRTTGSSKTGWVLTSIKFDINMVMLVAMVILLGSTVLAEYLHVLHVTR